MMENYAVVQNTDGNFNIVTEHDSNLDAAGASWHNQCRLLWNDSETTKYTCAVVNSKFEVVGDYRETKDKTPVPEPNAE